MDVSLVSYKNSEEYKTKSISEEYKMYKSSEEYQHELKATIASLECVSRQSWKNEQNEYHFHGSRKNPKQSSGGMSLLWYSLHSNLNMNWDGAGQ